MEFWKRLWSLGGLFRSGRTETPPVPLHGPANLELLQEKLGYRFRDPERLAHALVHRSALHASGGSRIESNERLEFLGDSVLGLVANEFLYAAYSDAEEGDLTKMKSKLVCGASLAKVAAQQELGVHVLMSQGEEATGGRARASILADLVEAIIGAVYLDGGLAAARGLVEDWVLDRSAELLADKSLANEKSRLQELVQSGYKSPPRYRILDAIGPDHERVFTVEVLVGDRVLGKGTGKSKKSAEQQAAGVALRAITAHPELLEPGLDPDPEVP
jgi:ribonuclease-3